MIYKIFDKFKSYSFWNIFLIICLITNILFLNADLFYEESLKIIQTTDQYRRELLPYGSICNDGTYSSSRGPGTCSWHGGVHSIYEDVLISKNESKELLYIEYSKAYQHAYLFFILSSLISLYFGKGIDKLIKKIIVQRAKLEAQRQAELEPQRQAKLEAQRQAKLEAQRQAELEAQRQAKLEAQRQAELKAQRQAELEAKKRAKLEAQRQTELEAKKRAEKRAQRHTEKRAELKAKRQAELAIRKKLKTQKQETTQNINIEQHSNWINNLNLNKKNTLTKKTNFRNIKNK